MASYFNNTHTTTNSFLLLLIMQFIYIVLLNVFKIDFHKFRSLKIKLKFIVKNLILFSLIIFIIYVNFPPSFL